MSKKSTRLKLFQNIFEDNGISSDSIELNDALVKHKLSDIIRIVFFAILSNANEWAEIESFAKKNTIGDAKIFNVLNAASVLMIDGKLKAQYARVLVRKKIQSEY